MRRIELVENGESTEVLLPAETGIALAESGIVSAVPSLTQGWWQIAPTNKVGVVRISDVEVWIQPKLEIKRLFFLLGYALDGRGWRDADVPLQEASDLLVAVAHAFTRQADRALQQGLLQGYRVTEEALTVLRGRMREGDQLRRRFGLAVPVEVRYDEFTVDIDENQLLRAAAERLLRLPRLPRETRRALLRLVLRLGDVSQLIRGRALPAWQPTRLNARYHLALRLAELVLRDASLEHAPGAVRADGFILDMAKLFEDFLTTAVAEALVPHGGMCVAQDKWMLDEADEITMKPDLVWYSDSAAVAAVIDAKYKAEKPSGFPDADLYQMLAYCTALGLPRGHLVYAKGNENAGHHVIRNSGVEIIQHALDLDQEPEALLGQVSALAAAIAITRATYADA